MQYFIILAIFFHFISFSLESSVEDFLEKNEDSNSMKICKEIYGNPFEYFECT